MEGVFLKMKTSTVVIVLSSSWVFSILLFVISEAREMDSVEGPSSPHSRHSGFTHDWSESKSDMIATKIDSFFMIFLILMLVFIFSK